MGYAALMSRCDPARRLIAGLLGLGLTLCLDAPVRADAEAPEPEPVSALAHSPYQVILERNPFNLKPIPTNAPTPAPGQPGGPPVKSVLQLSGISVDSLGKKAYLVAPAIPGKVTNAIYYTLREGETQGDIKVLTIDPKQKTVTVVNAGLTAQLDFASNAPQMLGSLAAVPGGTPPPRPGAAGAAAGQPLRSASNLPAAGGAAAIAAAQAGANPQSVARVNSTPIQPGAVSADGSAVGASRTIPSRSLRTPNPEPTAGGDAATQWLQWKAQEQMAISQGMPFPPPVPLPGVPE